MAGTHQFNGAWPPLTVFLIASPKEDRDSAQRIGAGEYVFSISEESPSLGFLRREDGHRWKLEYLASYGLIEASCQGKREQLVQTILMSIGGKLAEDIAEFRGAVVDFRGKRS